MDHGSFAALDQTEEHQIHIVSELLLGKLHQVTEPPCAGVINQDIDSAALFCRLRHKTVNPFRLGNIGLDCKNLFSAGPELFGGLIQTLLSPRTDDQITSFLGQDLSAGFADSLTGPCNQGHLSLQ